MIACRKRAGAAWLCALIMAALLPASEVRAETPRPPGIRILVVRTEAEARDAIAAYTAGTPFDRLVRERSIGPERERGGYLGRLNPAGLSPAARALVGKTPRGRLTPLFRTENGFAVIQVVTTQEEQELEARARAEPEARELLQRGTQLGQAGDLEGALPHLRRAVELNPDLEDAHFNLAMIYRKQGNLEAAIAAMRQVTQLHPDDFEAQMHLGAWLFEGRRYAEASEAYERAATLQMGSRDAWLKLAQAYQAAGKARAAVGAYRQAITLQTGNDPALYEAWLRVAMQAKDGPAAVAAARKFQALRPGHEGFLALGAALLLNGEAEAAVQEYQKAVALSPSSAAAHAGLGAASLRVGQGEAAAEHFLRAVQLEPQNPAHYRTLARLYEGQGRLDLAIVALRDGVSAAALSSPKLQAEVAEELAALYERAGMSREAALERLRVQSLRSP
ncbi:MAG: tetratricopeptide repeat protein [candidate division NC10 bacterium]|nr:tetratricopeptide repeat protein [candidate division NC10 bacterium]